MKKLFKKLSRHFEIDTSRGMAYGDDVMVEDYLLEVEERVDALPK